MELICAFLAILESVKMKRIRIYQNKLFGDIRIRAWTEDSGIPRQEQADSSPNLLTEVGERG